jgi:hypothetical protein
MEPERVGAVAFGTHVNVKVDTNSAVTIPGRWLRDHGDDPASIDPRTGQRLTDTFAIPRDIAATSVDWDGSALSIVWSDGATTSHDIDRLFGVVGAQRCPVPPRGQEYRLDPGARLWRCGPVPMPLPAAAIDDDNLWAEALTRLRDNGWLKLAGAELGRPVIERLARRLGYVRSTIFGDIWTMQPGADDHADSAYDSTALAVHTDGTYSHDAPGVIVFAQQERDGDGGDSVLVDGFAAAADLAAADPDAADLLTRFEMGGSYVEPGVSLRADRPPLRVDVDGVLRQITFNNYDRAGVLPASGWIDEVIDAYAAFHEVLSAPDRTLHLPWEPGQILLVDNWRVLHGRTAYTGTRGFLGYYTNHEDLESAWRLEGLVDRRGT